MAMDISKFPPAAQERIRKALKEQHGIDNASDWKKADKALSESRKTPRRKYRNEPCENDKGERFDSKLERAVVEAARQKYLAVIRQVTIRLEDVPAEDKRIKSCRPDMLIIREVREDGTFVGEFVDAKGSATDDWITKDRWMRDRYAGVGMRQVKKASDI